VNTLAKKPILQQKDDSVTRRLDALIRLFIEMNKEKKAGEKFNDTIAARILKSAGLTPTEIAKILGKKSAQDVSSYLYPKKNQNRGDKNAKENQDG
jgi:hypothetical protein